MSQPKPLQTHEWDLIWMSLRYACGRPTIVSATFPAMIIENYWTRLSDQQKRFLAENINDYLHSAGTIGHERIDHPIWMKFCRALDPANYYTVEADGETITVFNANNKTYPLDRYLSNPHQEVYLDMSMVGLIPKFSTSSEGAKEAIDHHPVKKF
jgi:hypothetical protein